MNAQYRVLLVEDSIKDAFLIVHELQWGGLDVSFERVETAEEIQTALEGKTWDFIICDYCLRGFDGLAVLAWYRRTALDIPFIMVSGKLGEEHAVEMLKAGAHEYILKDNLARLVPAVNRELRAAQERQIRREIEATAAYLASVVESCKDAIIGETLEGTVLTWNAGAERLYGYTASQMIGASVSVLISSYRPEDLRETLEKVSRGERVEGFETVCIRKNGSAMEVSLTISGIKDASGRIIGVSTVARDITLLKQEENERLGLIKALTEALAAKNDRLEQSGGPGPLSMEPCLHILLVDDDHADLALFGLAVDKTDLNIWLQTLTAGQSAIDYLEAKGVYADRLLHPLPDVVVLDLKMPQVSGFDFLAWRKPSAAFSSIPVIVLSGSQDQNEAQRAIKMGANKYIAKPTDFEDWKNLAREIWDFGTQGIRAEQLTVKG